MLTHVLLDADGALHAVPCNRHCRLRKVNIRQTSLLHLSSRLLPGSVTLVPRTFTGLVRHWGPAAPSEQ